MEYRMYIGGEFVDAKDGGSLEVISPATGEPIREVPYGKKEDAALAVDAAADAYPEWSGKNVYERCAFLDRAAAIMRERADDMARTVTMEVGKPLAESKGEVMGAIAQFEWYAEEVKRRWGEFVPASANNKRIITTRVPVGVVAAIAPWNFPVLLMARKVAPALACGCTVIGRPASQTPLGTMAMWNCLHDGGLPPGVANLITGSPPDTADVFMENGHVKKISFTGSVPVGKELLRKSADSMKKLSLELGGHSPFIVCDDVSAEEAAERAVFAKYRNMGQVCISPSRFFVPNSMKDEFEELASGRAKALRIGNGLEEGVDVGPLHDSLRVAETEALVQDVIDKGGRVLAGGKKPEGPDYEKGFWYEPTVVTDMNADMVLMQEEPFAPIMPIIGYDDLDDAIRMANDTVFGLAAYVLTNDITRAFHLGESLEAGIIGINDPSPAAAQAPFGGMKASGMGREGGSQGVDAYTETKYLSIMLKE